jgi:hypothetical protein
MPLFTTVLFGSRAAPKRPMIRISVLLWALAALLPAHATTLGRASFDDLAQKSTSIVRGRVVSSYSASRGFLVYTYYRIRVLDRWKGPVASQIDVQVPGGTVDGLQQNIAGVPQLTTDSEYVFFLWTGPSGATHVLGLSQGVLDLTTNAAGEPTLSSQITDALMVDSATGQAAAREPLRMKLSEFSSRLAKSLQEGASVK